MKRTFLHYFRIAKERPYFYGAIGAAVLLVLFFMFGRGSATAYETMVIEQSDFNAQISVAGNVIAAQEVELGFAQSGRVTGVYASVGDTVGAGKVLANTENGELRAALDSARAKLQAALEGTRPEEIRIAEADVANDKLALVDEIKDAYQTADDAVRTKTAELFNNPRSYPTLTFITESSRGKSESQERRRDLEDTLVEWEKEVNALTVASNLDTATARAQSILSEIATFLSYVSLALNEALADDFNTQTELDAYTAGITTARNNTSSAQSALTSAKAALDTSRNNLTLELAGSRQSDIDIERANVKAAEAELAKTLITAPFAGIITVMDAKVGEIVSPNTSEISMISRGKFQIESYIPEVIIAQVKIGNTAEVYLDAYGANTPFEATVVSIDPAETEREGVSTYKTVLQFNAEDPRIRPGMTANITVTTEEKPDTIVIPQGALIRRGEEAFVHILEGKNAVERKVETGLTSLGQIEITSGLHQGDTIILNP